jgi:excisionase family DNA binding protein
VLALGVLKNWIDDGELLAVRVGARRVRVRESDLAAFLAASRRRHEQLEADDPWAPVYIAAKAALGATRRQDRAALERAISQLADAAREIASEPVGRRE